MMREILFRGKRADNGEWVFGYFCEFANNRTGEQESYIQTVKQDGRIDLIHKVDPKTAGQFTGLTDKHGKRMIFEGDVVRGTDRGDRFPEVYGYVGHRDGAFVIFGDFMTHYRWLDYDVEVIGNLHDNPELIGGGGDG